MCSEMHLAEAVAHGPDPALGRNPAARADMLDTKSKDCSRLASRWISGNQRLPEAFDLAPINELQASMSATIRIH